MSSGRAGVRFRNLLILLATILLGKPVIARAGCVGEVGKAWSKGICTIYENGTRSEACKPCLVGPEWDQFREELGTPFVRGRRATKLNIGIPNWSSATLLTSAFRIIAEELLGYDRIATVSNGGMMTSETADPECKAIFMEVWNGGADMEAQRVLIEDEQIIMSSYLGSSGHETLYVPAFMPFLSSHYRSLHENIRQVMPDGSTVAAMDGFVRDGTISAANLSVFFNGSNFACDDGANKAWNVSKCVEGRWYPEQCGETFPSPTCAEAYMPSFQWSAGHLESAIRNLGLNFSVVYTGVSGLKEIIRKSHENKEGILYYWWEPEPLHVKYPSQKLILPPYTPECEAVLHADPMLSENSCDTGQILLRKFMHVDLKDSDPDLYNLWEKFQFNTDEIYSFMEFHEDGGGAFNFEDAACEFLKADTEVNWRSWVSINDFCSSYGENFEWLPEEKKCIATLDRNSCIPGTYFDVAQDKCATCLPGQYTNSSGLTQCSPCQPGTACGSPGCSKCDLCPSGTYTEELAAQQCKPCPDNTHTYTQEGADKVERCVCREGFYRRDSSLGAECYACPDGGVCLGGATPPHASPGFWGDWSLVDKSVPDSKRAAEEIRPRLFHRCTNPSSCNGCDSLSIKDQGGAVSLEEAEHACRLDPQTICDPKYNGVMCFACSEGHFSIQGQCMSCPPLGWLFTLSGILLIIVIWYLLNRVAAAEYDAVDLLLLYFQNASTVSTFTLGWSNLLVTVPFLVLAVVNFDVTYMSWDCLFPMQHSPVLSYGFGFGLQLALPLILVAGYVCHYLLYKLTQAIGVSTRRSEEEVVDDSIASVGAFVNLVIHTITLKCLEPLMCIQMPGQNSVLRAGPGIPCWEGAHIGFVVAGLLGGLIYTVGFPTLCMAALRYGTKHNMLRTGRFQRRWGWLYLRYEREWFYWELLIMGRRCALIVIAVLAVNLASIQIVLGASVCVMAMTMHFYARPFIDESLDRLEMMSLISLMMLIFMGVLFTDDTGRMQFSAWDDVANALTILSILGCMGLAVRMVYANVRERTAIRKVSRRMRRAIQGVLSPGGDTPSAPLISARFSLSGVVRAAVSRAGDSSSTTETSEDSCRGTSVGSVSESTHGQHVNKLDAETLELHETLDVRQIEKWMSNLSIQGVRGTLRGSMLQPVGSSVSSRAPLFSKRDRSNSAVKFEHGICEESSRKGIVNFWLANHWMAPLMSDSSPVSCYSTRGFSSFFTNLIDQNPYLIDHLLFASGEELVAAKSAINDLREAQVYHTLQGRLAQMVSEKDRGAFLAWLLIAEASHVRVVRDLMVDIWCANNDGRHPLQDLDGNDAMRDAAPTSGDEFGKHWAMGDLLSMIGACLVAQHKPAAVAPQPSKDGDTEDGVMRLNDGDSKMHCVLSSKGNENRLVPARPSPSAANSIKSLFGGGGVGSSNVDNESAESRISQARKIACRMQISRIDEDMRRLAQHGEEVEAMLLSQLQTELD